MRSLDDLRKTAVVTRGNGTPVYLEQVATVEFAPLLRQGASTRDGKGEAVVGVVMLLVGENSREVVNHVKARLDEIRQTLPPNIEIDVFYDRSELIAATVHTLGKNLVEGGILVVAVLLFTLGSLRAGLVVALAVPLSMAGAFLGMWLAGLSGNLMSLGAIDFGLIVDGPVVLIEHVVRRLAERKRAGETGARAVSDGTRIMHRGCPSRRLRCRDYFVCLSADLNIARRRRQNVSADGLDSHFCPADLTRISPDADARLGGGVFSGNF